MNRDDVKLEIDVLSVREQRLALDIQRLENELHPLIAKRAACKAMIRKLWELDREMELFAQTVQDVVMTSAELDDEDLIFLPVEPIDDVQTAPTAILDQDKGGAQ